MEIPKFNNPFKKKETVVEAPVEPPIPGIEETQAMTAEQEAIKQQTPTEEKPAQKKDELTLEQVLMNFDLRLQRIEYNLRLLN